MSFSGNYLCTSFKKELLTATHDFTPTTGSTFKLALYDNNASFNADTTVYTTSNEVSGTGYSAGGETLTAIAPVTSGRAAYTDFEDLTFSTVTITPRGGLIYNSSESNKVVAVLDFGYNIVRTAADLLVTFPDPNINNAIVRIA